MLRNKLYLRLISFISFLIASALILMIYNQSSIIKLLKKQHFANKSQSIKLKLQNNLNLNIKSLRLFSDPIRLSEVFFTNSISIEDFPNFLGTGINRIRITDKKGQILLSTDLKEDSQKSISELSLFWINNFFTMPFFFFSNRDTLVGIIKYENPYSLLEDNHGYILTEFSSSVILRDIKIDDFFVRMINQQLPILLLTDTDNINPDKASQIVKSYYKKNIPSNIGYNLVISNMAKIIYYVDNKSYYPLFLFTIIFLLLLLTIACIIRLYFISKFNDDKSSSIKNPKLSKLLSDIQNGNTYNKNDALSMLDNASKYGSFEEIRQEKIISVDIENTKVNRPRFESLMNKNMLNIESETQKLEMIIPNQELDLNTINMNISIEDQEEFLLENENIILEEQDDNLEEQEISIENFNREQNDNLYNTMQLFINKLNKVMTKLDITHYAFGERIGDEFIFNNTQNFPQSFKITTTDPLYQEILSQDKVLSISGNLLEIPYLDSFLPHDFLENIKELSILPIKDNQEIQGIAILARDNMQELLTEDEKKELFTVS